MLLKSGQMHMHQMQMLDLYLNKCATAKCKVVCNGDDGFEVNEGKDRHIVNLSTYRCTC